MPFTWRLITNCKLQTNQGSFCVAGNPLASARDRGRFLALHSKDTYTAVCGGLETVLPATVRSKSSLPPPARLLILSPSFVLLTLEGTQLLILVGNSASQELVFRKTKDLIQLAPRSPQHCSQTKCASKQLGKDRLFPPVESLSG